MIREEPIGDERREMEVVMEEVGICSAAGGSGGLFDDQLVL